MIKEYLKLARISIASITGLAPVMGFIAAGQYQISYIIILFFIGFFGHSYGMIQNDLVDYKIDRKSSEIADRPLVSKTISIKQAQVFAILCLLTMFVLAIFLAILNNEYFSILFLFVPTIFVTLYNIYGKIVPFTDVFLAIGMFFFILYGAVSQQFMLNNLPLLVWIICFLGTIQMLSINVIQGGFKDIQNDKMQDAKTGIMTLGLQITGNKIYVSNSFKFITYLMQVVIIFIAYFPFLIKPDFVSQLSLKYLLILLVTLVGIITIFVTHKYLSFKVFERGRIRMLFNLQGYVNFILAPILLISVTPFALFIIPIPAIGFLISSALYKEKFMQPASM